MIEFFRKLFGFQSGGGSATATLEPPTSPSRSSVAALEEAEDEPPESAQLGIVDSSQPLGDEEESWASDFVGQIESGEVKVELAPAADTHRKIMLALANPKLPVQKISEAIRADPVVAGAVLKMANSPFFSGSGSATADLDAAIVRLGQRQLKLLLLTFMLQSKKVRDVRTAAISKLQWKHSLMTAKLAAVIAKRARVDEDSAYVAGLLHNVGVLAVLTALAKCTDEASQRAIVEVIHRSAYAYNAEVIESWNLTAEVTHAVKSYRGDLSSPLVAVVALANDLCKAHGLWAEQAEVDLEAHPALEVLGLTPAQVPARSLVLTHAHEVASVD